MLGSGLGGFFLVGFTVEGSGMKLARIIPYTKEALI